MVKRLARQFGQDTRGNVALIFAAVAVPLFIGAGMAIDISRHGYHQRKLAVAADGAALAVARMEDGASQSEMLQIAQQYIDMNYTRRDDLRGNQISLSVSLANNVVTVNADVDVPTTITTLAGVYNMPARVTSEVTKGVLGTEIALVLDNTGSMGNDGKIEALQSASDTLLDVLFNTITSTNKLKIAVVPFSAAVNVGTVNDTAAWLDTAGDSTVSRINFENNAWHNWRGWQELTNRSWNGCVQARAMPYDIQDDVPNTGNPETLFAPYFAPDEPDEADSGVANNYNYDYNNDYIDDALGESNPNLIQRQRHGQKYVNASVSSSSKGPGYNCGISALTPLTSEETVLRSAIDAMVATGYTNITQGIAWGWHALSPTAPLEEGEDYNNAAWKKYMIVMTDGDNNWGNINTHNGTRYTGYGFIAQDRLGETNSGLSDDTLDARTAAICTNVKNATGSASTAITVYTITFGDPGQATRDMMKACATNEYKYYHAPNSAALTAVFENIADEIGSIRLSK
ncbi:MAG: pilus assembly protein [Rhizobiales bacterium]|nr:pilus assembly protein [Hyphomicrobiales bacterium]